MTDNRKSKLWSTPQVGAGLNDTVGPNNPIPDGETWIITRFGAADINTGDNKSSIYTLKFGGEILDGALIIVTGNTHTLNENWELKGDGVKKIEIDRRNTSGQAKLMPCWVVAFNRS